MVSSINYLEITSIQLHKVLIISLKLDSQNVSSYKSG